MAASFLVTKALKYQNAGPVSIANSSNIVISFVFQVTILREPTDRLSVIGAVLVVGSGLILAGEKWVRDKVAPKKIARKKMSDIETSEDSEISEDSGISEIKDVIIINS